MGRPQIVEVDYYEFVKRLKAAVNAGGRIEITDKEKWKVYLVENKINDIAMKSWGKLKFASGKPTLVIIDDGTDWNGMYAYSHEDEAALKWIRLED